MTLCESLFHVLETEKVESYYFTISETFVAVKIPGRAFTSKIQGVFTSKNVASTCCYCAFKTSHVLRNHKQCYLCFLVLSINKWRPVCIGRLVC